MKRKGKVKKKRTSSKRDRRRQLQKRSQKGQRKVSDNKFKGLLCKVNRVCILLTLNKRVDIVLLTRPCNSSPTRKANKSIETVRRKDSPSEPLVTKRKRNPPHQKTTEEATSLSRRKGWISKKTRKGASKTR